MGGRDALPRRVCPSHSTGDLLFVSFEPKVTSAFSGRAPNSNLHGGDQPQVVAWSERPRCFLVSVKWRKSRKVGETTDELAAELLWRRLHLRLIYRFTGAAAVDLPKVLSRCRLSETLRLQNR